MAFPGHMLGNVVRRYVVLDGGALLKIDVADDDQRLRVLVQEVGRDGFALYILDKTANIDSLCVAARVGMVAHVCSDAPGPILTFLNYLSDAVKRGIVLHSEER
ncbi:MAG: hypothetical protein DRO39_07050 [Thermoprotei archaeon]|nr:MAG: hypothetical protein DRO39_07050 [Thermoprotei archaeon]